MEHLHPKAIWIFFFNFLFAGLALLIIFGFLWLAPLLGIFGRTIFGFFVVILIVFVLYIAFCWAWAKLSYNAYKYQIAEDAFKKEHGVIWKRYVSIPYERIQNVDIHRGVIARILGLSDLMIQTAGYSATAGRYGLGVRDPEGRLPGISQEKAEQLREELIKRAKGMKSGTSGI